MKNILKSLFLSIVLIFTSCIPIEGKTIESTFSIQFIDVGQGDSALVECDGHYMLIDGGSKSNSQKIYTILKNKSIHQLDIVVATHVHDDHIGGIPGAYNYAKSDLTLCPTKEYESKAFQDFKKYADKNGNGITVPSVNDTYDLGSATIKIVGINDGEEINDTSIVLKITYGDNSFLFTGDCEIKEEAAIYNRNINLTSSVLKIGHHGSDSSTSSEFLNKVNPKYAILSVGKNNAYGHPTKKVLDLLHEKGIEIYRTDLNGDIFVFSDGKNITVTTEKTATEDSILTPGENKEEVEDTNIIENETIEPEQNVVEYIVNTNTKKFHYSTCRSVKTMKEKNTMHYKGTRDELIGQGYSPCQNCHP